MGSNYGSSYGEIVIDEISKQLIPYIIPFFFFLISPQDTVYLCLLDTFVKLVVFWYQFPFFIFPHQERKLVFKLRVSLKFTERKEAGELLLFDKKLCSWK